MKRTALHRHAQLQRHAYLRAVNPARKAKRREAGEVYGPGYLWMTRQPCILRSRPDHRCAWSQDRQPEAHHVKSVGAGGRDAEDTVPVCHVAHDALHSMGPETFERRHNVSLTTLARDWWIRYRSSQEVA